MGLAIRPTENGYAWFSTCNFTAQINSKPMKGGLAGQQMGMMNALTLGLLSGKFTLTRTNVPAFFSGEPYPR